MRNPSCPSLQASFDEGEAIKHFEEGLKILARLMVRAVIQEVQGLSGIPISARRESLFNMRGSSSRSEKLTYSVPEVSNLLGLSRASVYEAVKSKQIPSINFGRRVFIPCVALHRLLSEKVTIT